MLVVAGLTDRAARMITVVSILVALATMAVALRIYARLKLRLKIQTDDYLCVGALVCLHGMLIELAFWCTIGGNGSHAKDLSPHTLMNFAKIFLANQFTYFVLCPLLRISIIFFYRRLFSTRPFMRITTGLMWLIGLWGLGIFLACALQCRPLSGYWNPEVEAECFDENTFFIVNQVFNVIMDFVLLALPLPIIWRLHRTWTEKLSLSGVFLLGGFVCFASIFRIVVLFYIDAEDTTYTVYQATLWTHIEPSVGMICCCLPSIRGLLPAHLFPGSRKGTTNSRNAQASASAKEASSRNTTSSMYIKMGDVTPSRDDSVENLVTAEGITVRTDIAVTRHEA